MEEVWKDIKGYEGLYQVSNIGRVYSYYSNQIMKQQLHKGYLYVKLCKNKIQTTFQVHRLVAINFINNPHQLRVINHINCIKTDNRIKNLEWCTQKENIQHAILNNLGVGKFRKQGHKIGQYNKQGEFVNKFQSISEASKNTGVKVSNISFCCKGTDGRSDVKSAGGYIWKYIK